MTVREVIRRRRRQRVLLVGDTCRRHHLGISSRQRQCPQGGPASNLSGSSAIGHLKTSRLGLVRAKCQKLLLSGGTRVSTMEMIYHPFVVHDNDHELSARLALPTAESPTLYPSGTDSNNNSDADKRCDTDKYSLRPRSLRRRRCDTSLGTSPEVSSGGGDPATATGPKPKQKPAPLSKYRRKTANARERSRMREINQAFETLRQAVPQVYSTASVGTPSEKLTKITTLRLAMKYISTLSAALGDDSTDTLTISSTSDAGSDSSSTSSTCCRLLLEPADSVSGESLLESADFTLEFPDDSLDFPPLSPGDFSGHLVTAFDPFLSEIS